MSVSMIGIDFNKASVDIRSKFSFTKKNIAESLKKLKKQEGVAGCIILSTCNRMEIWVSAEENEDIRLYDFLCEEKQAEGGEYRQYFVERKGRDAVEHLFYLASGLKSQILAEDQILTQVKDALVLARNAYCTDNVLEVLFRMAVTAAKKVKTEVAFSRANTSVIYQALQEFHRQGISLQNRRCMVIGNGEMGKLTALALREEGAEVTVTVRQYRSGVVQIPSGCARINYGDRMKLLPECDLVVSATASPNCTITKEDFLSAGVKKDMLLIDLAVPRDIDAEIGSLPHVTLYNIDSFRVKEISPEMQKNLDQASAILQEHMDEFYTWFSGKDLFPVVQKIRQEAVEDFNARILKVLKKTSMEEEEWRELLQTLDTAAGKVVIKMMFALRDGLSTDAFAECVACLQNLYEAQDE